MKNVAVLRHLELSLNTPCHRRAPSHSKLSDPCLRIVGVLEYMYWRMYACGSLNDVCLAIVSDPVYIATLWQLHPARVRFVRDFLSMFGSNPQKPLDPRHVQALVSIIGAHPVSTITHLFYRMPEQHLHFFRCDFPSHIRHS